MEIDNDTRMYVLGGVLIALLAIVAYFTELDLTDYEKTEGKVDEEEEEFYK